MKPKINEYLCPYHWSFQGFRKYWYERPIRLIASSLKETDVVLDAGCGDGKLTSLIAPLVQRIHGVDNQEFPIKFAKLIFNKLKIQNANLSVEDVTNLEFADNFFDKIVCFDVIEHLPKGLAINAINELYRVLKSGGRLYLTTPNREELRGRFFGHKIEDKHYYEYSIGELKRLFNKFKNLEFKGIYFQLPIPKIEHVADLFLFRKLFEKLVVAGRNYPQFSRVILLEAEK
jgi:SAM-dependent methyltransferase